LNIRLYQTEERICELKDGKSDYFPVREEKVKRMKGLEVYLSDRVLT
jgi:hypothetical protein